ncbi:DNA polymerase III subunit beta [Mycoplasma nasistruthionis]|uniref:DNA polymerase III subunit beta n=1 Tax=Mycoplasma nasistruthionis TaxID=353852 RepID=A0A4Y6I702_9MOLU|nr:DNA polymerase III subunit beta [Mycoplasma nasistruthionis]QDF65161.1 hypothetical protein FIV53_02595 [Mycoplasma nasistruthionis]
MKFQISKNKIEHLVEFISNYIDSSDTYPTFRCINFSIDNEYLTLVGASSIMGAKKRVKVDETSVKVTREGSVLINANILKNIIKKFDKFVTFETKGNLIDIYEGTTKFTLTKIDASEYPQISFDEPENPLQINSKEFEKIVSDVSISTTQTSDKLISVIYKCINLHYLHTEDNRHAIRFVATDSYRLSTQLLFIDQPIDLNIVIDAKNLKKIITKDAPENVGIYFTKSRIGIIYEDTTVWVVLNKAEPIQIQGLLQTKFSRHYQIDRDELIRTINKALFYTNEKDKKMAFNFSENELNLNYEIPELGTGTSNTSGLKIVKGYGLEIDFNYNYVKEAAGVLNPGLINIFISENADKVLISSESDKNHIQFITPLRRY